MIITKLQGGLGNQLFQWAVSKSLSIDYNTDYYFDLSYFYNQPIGGLVTQWKLDLYKFKKIQIKELNNSLNLSHIGDNFNYKKILNNSYLNGYWQSEKYFKNNENDIRNDLEIDENLKNYITNKYPILNENTLSIHVRRGDYVNLTDYHALQSIEYYKNGYDIINDNNINVLIFSDDINWCEKNLNFNNTHFIKNENNITDLYMMSMCKHNIIANSSFSWWSAWINLNSDKKIISPNKWFGDKNNLNTGDIIPEKWIKI